MTKAAEDDLRAKRACLATREKILKQQRDEAPEPQPLESKAHSLVGPRVGLQVSRASAPMVGGSFCPCIARKRRM